MWGLAQRFSLIIYTLILFHLKVRSGRYDGQLFQVGEGGSGTWETNTDESPRLDHSHELDDDDDDVNKHDNDDPMSWWLDTDSSSSVPDNNDPTYRFTRVHPTKIRNNDIVRVEFKVKAPDPLDFIVGAIELSFPNPFLAPSQMRFKLLSHIMSHSAISPSAADIKTSAPVLYGNCASDPGYLSTGEGANIPLFAKISMPAFDFPVMLHISIFLSHLTLPNQSQPYLTYPLQGFLTFNSRISAGTWHSTFSQGVTTTPSSSLTQALRETLKRGRSQKLRRSFHLSTTTNLFTIALSRPRTQHGSDFSGALCSPGGPL